MVHRQFDSSIGVHKLAVHQDPLFVANYVAGIGISLFQHVYHGFGSRINSRQNVHDFASQMIRGQFNVGVNKFTIHQHPFLVADDIASVGVGLL